VDNKTDYAACLESVWLFLSCVKTKLCSPLMMCQLGDHVREDETVAAYSVDGRDSKKQEKAG